MLGLITVYKVPNYGTKLQAYAMQQMLNKYDKTKVINFKGSTDYRFSAVIGKIKLKLQRVKRRKKENESYIKYKEERVNSINQFDKTFYSFSELLIGTHQIRKYLKNCSVVVCGSDQLWAPSNVDADYFTLTIVPPGIRRVSFAASFGISKIPNSYQKKYRRFLKKMDYIAVREESGKQIVEEISGKNATVTLDPTLMLSADQWNALANKSRLSYTDYIFCYFLGDNNAHRMFARELAQRVNKKIITIPHCEQYNKADIDFADVEIRKAMPMDFLNLIRNADYICTDSFHGTVFSTVFHKKVAVFERFGRNLAQSTNSRIYSLLSMLGESQILYSKPEDVDSFLMHEFDYEQIDYRIKIEREKSFAYLDQALLNISGKEN